MSDQQVPYFKSHQNPQLDAPAFFVSQDKARGLKKERTHYFASHSVQGYAGVKAIVEVPSGALPEMVKSQRAEKEFSRWAVVGQTVRESVKRNKLGFGPGCPGWELVRLGSDRR